MTGMLASVENLDEALLVMEAGADIIDLKAPSLGALGALPHPIVTRIVTGLGGRRPLSATIGDLPMEPRTVADAAESMAATGVDYVKIGFFPGGDWQGSLQALAPIAAQGIRLAAVLFGDRRPSLSLLESLVLSGFVAVMLDTIDKGGGSLTQTCPMAFLRDFVAAARAAGLISGLAGSLRHSDVPVLLDLQPDYLGFRGALCHRQSRTSGVDRNAVTRIRSLIPA